MTNEVIGLPRGRSLTRADLDQMPDDGHRYELIDGLLIVSPAPRTVHQRVVVRLISAVHTACPAGLEALVAPFDVVLDRHTVIQPDVLVARASAFTDSDLPAAPLLAIEVLSPRTRAYDLLLKKNRLERAGCPHYWVIDPYEPSIRAWTLTNGSYTEVAHVQSDHNFTVTEPFDITLNPHALSTGQH